MVEKTQRLEYVQHNHIRLEQIQLQRMERGREKERGKDDNRGRGRIKKDQPVERKVIIKRESDVGEEEGEKRRKRDEGLGSRGY